ncbi:transposase [Cohnella kolymensis]|uniref:transposase n=1 Tax=Cohnella kolymensis TaxID=1590652 RepID=UPI000697AB58|nr:transposase [Cohnella kolymensis]
MVESLGFEEFCERFEQEDVCRAALYEARWPDGFRCPRCDDQHAYVIRSRKLPLYECSSCRHQTSHIAGTIFEGSRTPLRLWFQALYLHAQPGGISALRLASIIDTTYKTAWLICHKIRHAMREADKSELLTGLVRINWGQYGGPYNPTVYLHPQEHILLMAASIEETGELAQVKIKQVPQDHLNEGYIVSFGKRQFIKEHVAPDAYEVIVETRKFRANKFQPLFQMCKKLNCWLNFTFHGIGGKHLQAYLDQYCFGMNMQLRRQPILTKLLELSASTPTLTYPVLIRDKTARRKSRPLSFFRVRAAAS